MAKAQIKAKAKSTIKQPKANPIESSSIRSPSLAHLCTRLWVRKLDDLTPDTIIRAQDHLQT
jgi:hypothetical protein